jgi:hypothetical protein
LFGCGCGFRRWVKPAGRGRHSVHEGGVGNDPFKLKSAPCDATHPASPPLLLVHTPPPPHKHAKRKSARQHLKRLSHGPCSPGLQATSSCACRRGWEWARSRRRHGRCWLRRGRRGCTWRTLRARSRNAASATCAPARPPRPRVRRRLLRLHRAFFIMRCCCVCACFRQPCCAGAALPPLCAPAACLQPAVLLWAGSSGP